ncbi:hypothetical protein RE628_04550 [Paenibacillus sp. D2_2]|uniref:hypothetical protein n=1 Tax=Paenibacillus sp. D2_2 TaxID=3073092 RepID=UPI0028153314|nr:hypothetical protein [Paenibacillus sp. D2_2]WMT41764.1 hypothetical protein RE628_04550 [Paenibacillus sp. D2_2]
MRAIKVVCLVLLGGLLTISAVGCGGGGNDKPSDKASSTSEIQQIESSTKTTAIQETTSPTETEDINAQPSNDTSMNIVDMPNQIVIKDGDAQGGGEPPDGVPDDIPILDDALNTTAVKIGDGASSGDPYYHVQFNMKDSVEQTIESYRKVLKDSGLDIASESDEDGMMHFTVDTKSWEAQMMIFTLLEKTTVWINYVKK